MCQAIEGSKDRTEVKNGSTIEKLPKLIEKNWLWRGWIETREGQKYTQ